jgi:hypothetical protein
VVVEDVLVSGLAKAARGEELLVCKPGKKEQKQKQNYPPTPHITELAQLHYLNREVAE